MPIKNLDGFLSGVVVKTSTGNEESLTRDDDQRFALIMAVRRRMLSNGRWTLAEFNKFGDRVNP